MLNGYSEPMPNVIGSAMKFKKLSFSLVHAATPTIQTTPSTRAARTTPVPRRFLVDNATTTATAANDANVASGPSRSIERIISANTVERLAVITRVPSGSSMLSVVLAIRRRL